MWESETVDTPLAEIYAGPLWEMDLLSTLLDEAGIRSWIPDRNMKFTDPFATGANPLTAFLYVRQIDAEPARAVIESQRAQHAWREGEALDGVASDGGASGHATSGDGVASDSVGDALPPPPGGAPENAADAVERLAVRSRWACVLPITFPVGLYWGWRYLKRCHALGLRSHHHTLTVAGLGIALLWCATTVAIPVLLAPTGAISIGLYLLADPL